MTTKQPAPPPKFPNRIAEIRQERGWSMEELAARANTTASQINKLEKGRVRLNFDWMHRLARALEVHPVELHPGVILPTPEEQALLDRYRGLSEADRDTTFRFVDTMAKGEKGKGS